jgi:hypothetical protein
MHGMDAKFWKRALKEAERELDAARTRTALNAAAKKLMLAKQQLKRLQMKGRPPDRRHGGALARASLVHCLTFHGLFKAPVRMKPESGERSAGRCLMTWLMIAGIVAVCALVTIVWLKRMDARHDRAFTEQMERLSRGERGAPA